MKQKLHNLQIVGSMIAVVGLTITGCETLTTAQPEVIDAPTAEETIAETEPLQEDPAEPYAYIDTFVLKYNETAETPMSDGMDIDIHDKNSGYYRTEYRLNSFKNAVARRYMIGESPIDIIHTNGEYTGNIIRIYFGTDSADAAGCVFDVIARLMYPDITTDELSDAHENMQMDISSNILRKIKYYYISGYEELFMDNIQISE